MFGQYLKEIIENKCDTFLSFAEKCNISRGHLNDIFAGRILPKEALLDTIIENLQPMAVEKRKKLIQEWAFDKSNGILRKDFEELQKRNKEITNVLDRLEKEKDLLEKVDSLQKYKEFYNAFFKDLTAEETKVILTAISKELKVLALDNNRLEQSKKKIEKLEQVIKELK